MAQIVCAHNRSRVGLLCVAGLLGLSLSTAAIGAGVPDPSADHRLAQEILQAAGIRGGLVVHLGCGDGTLTAALSASDACLVQGLDGKAENVATARRHVSHRGLYGQVSIERWDARHLPYTDNLVNLMVAEDPEAVTMDEVARVLAPGGVALIAGRGSRGAAAEAETIEIAGKTWTKTVKPWPEEIDEWTHYLHDATGNAVAQDTVVGPPKRFQWIGSPRWLRHHDHLSGLSAMVSARGRLFYIVDLGPRWSVEMPPRWTLVARDAFNGTVLWQRPIDPWHAHLWPLKRGPAGLMRRLVAEGDTVYVTLGVGKPLTALDAATGRTVRTYEGTDGAEEIILSGGTLFVLVNPELDAYKTLPRESVDLLRRAGRDWNWDERPRRLMAIEAETGRVRWSHDAPVAPDTLTAAGPRVYFHDGDHVVCLDERDGARVWASKPLPRWKPMHVLFGPTLVVYDDVVLFAGGENMDPIRGGKDTMTALSAETGDPLWTAPHPPSGYASAEDLFVIDGLVWCGVTTSRRDSGVFTGRDLHTGEVKVEFPPDDWPHMPHHRCHRAKATCQYILTSRTGIEFVDLGAQHWTAHHWVRGSCNYGILPANGLLYAPPHSCACYPVAKLNAFNALAPAGGNAPAATDQDDKAVRLERGPVYGDPVEPRSSGVDSPSSDWPTYRRDATRSGSTDAAVPAELKRLWQADVGGKLTSVVVADGKVFVASVDRHTVHALDATSGRPLWEFTAGGRVDSPPTVWQGRVLFGSADGCVYSLRAADGALAWRFRAAPQDRWLTAFEQVESAWPVHGSVLVHRGVVYCVAGRSMWLDGGMRLVRLDAHSGRKLSETVLDDKYPDTEDNLQRDIKWPNLPVALPDVLSCDGRHVYMRTQPFDLEGKRTEVLTTRDYTEQQGETAHLFSPTGFLDDAWWHRSYWTYGRSFIGGAGGWYLAAYQAPAGRILCVDDSSVYGFGRVPLRFIGTPNAYHLFACAKEPDIINPNPKRPPRKQGTSIYGRVVPTLVEYRWSEGVPLLARAMVATDQKLFIAGPPAVADEAEVYGRYGDLETQAKMAEHVAAFNGQQGAVLMAVSKTDGKRLAAYRLESIPVFDGLAATAGRLFLSSCDGHVLALGAGDGPPLEPAPDATPGPVPTGIPRFAETKSHPDFQHLAMIGIGKSDLGYRMQTAPREVGLALKKLASPLTGRVEFRMRVRPTPGASSPDTPGNGFLVFGDSGDEGQLVKCGFRISGKSLSLVQGPLLAGRSKGKRADVKANEVAELRVVVDLDAQTVALTMHGETVETPLERPLDAITWIGYCLTSVTTEFGPIEITSAKKGISWHTERAE